MPALKNLLHERFCVLFPQLKLRGLSNGQVYIKAGGASRTAHAADVNASKLLKRQDVLDRIAEIGEPAVRQAELDGIELKDKLEMVFFQALADGDFTAANRAAELTGKLTGELIERSENRTSLALDTMNSADDVIQALFEQIGAKQARTLAKALGIALDSAGKVIEMQANRADEWRARVTDRARQLPTYRPHAMNGKSKAE